MPTELTPRLPRVPFDQLVRLLPVDGTNGSTVRAGNLSLGGLFVQSEQPFAVGDQLMLALPTAGPAFHLGQAEVVWRKLDGVGLRFLKLEATGRALVETVVKHGGTSSTLRKAMSSEAPTLPDIPLLDAEPSTQGD